jgi:hypothetical protein
VVHTCNPHTQVVEVGGLRVRGQPRLHSEAVSTPPPGERGRERRLKALSSWSFNLPKAIFSKERLCLSRWHLFNHRSGEPEVNMSSICPAPARGEGHVKLV